MEGYRTIYVQKDKELFIFKYHPKYEPMIISEIERMVEDAYCPLDGFDKLVLLNYMQSCGDKDGN